MKNKKANILTENIIFIVLNLTFLAILILFLFTKTGSAAVLEEKYSKELALIVDSARPGMTIVLEMEDAVKEAESNGIAARDMVTVQGNVILVTLDDKGGHSYSFFNDIDFEGPSYDAEKKGVRLIFNE